MRFALIIFALSSVAHAADEPVLLRTRPTANSAFRFEFVNVTSQQLSVLGRETVTDISSELQMSLATTEVALDRTSFSARFANGSARVSIRGLEDELASSDTVHILTQINGKQMHVVVSNLGEIISLYSSTSPMVVDFIKQVRVMENVVLPFPKSAVSVGEVWKTSRTDTMPAPQGEGSIVTRVTLANTYLGQIDTLGIRCWVIEGRSTSFYQTGSISIGNTDIDLDGSGSLFYRSVVESSTGVLMHGTSSITSNARMAMSGPQQLIVPVDTHATFVAKRIMDSRR